ncbi:sensor histidine kinase [Aestuariivivens insulae]|uniref:sensor histidine kinase n=1 Tax=Aestuariivivens insulae TaxID=1621988 RepID=UPI001F57AC28|nr:ATP-binding protein [Aestuariivivens insulae]
MNNMKYRWLLYAIVFVIITTIGIQVYWNYKNYLVNKQQLTNDVQQSADNAIETYFANLAAQNTIAYAVERRLPEDSLSNSQTVDSLINVRTSKTHGIINIDSLGNTNNKDIYIFKGKNIDSVIDITHGGNSNSTWRTTRQIAVEHAVDFDLDSILNFKDFRNLTTKVIISMTKDSLKLETIDSLLHKDLLRKQIDVDYGITLESAFSETQKLKSEYITPSSLSVVSSSNYLPRQSKLTVYFNNTVKTILKRSLTGILLSALLILAVISCLFYLLKIIKHQKQLAEVKNDLISNITHEFKTPIATIGVALESIKSFNVIDDKAKTKTYIDLSSNQLNKLNVMVEKLLETATLDSETLQLNKDTVDLTALLSTLTHRYKVQHSEKQFVFDAHTETHLVHVDAFHIENALNNILDNAVKYGGDTIEIVLIKHNTRLDIVISDNGDTLKKAHKDKIFEKFYRVPRGNTHDVKGFGIGLYYTKTIIEKHNGSITVNIDQNKTAFKITLPNG